MAFDIQWKIYYSDITGYGDITSYVQELNVDVSAELGTGGRAMAQIIINNDTGAFTPGGTGTYASIDWFSKALEIQAVADGNTAYVFSGLIADFQIEQISIKESVVTISALDFISIGGRSESSPPKAVIAVGYADAMIQVMFNSDGTYFANPETPTMGSTAGKESLVNAQAGTAMTTYLTSTQLSTSRIGDWVNNNVLTTGPMALVPAGYSAIVSDQWQWVYFVIDQTLNRIDLDKKEFTIVDKSGTIASGEIPITDLDVGFDLDNLTNITTVCDANSTYTAVTATNSTSTKKYGPRARAYFSTMPDGSNYVTSCANFWTNRYSTVRYIPRKLVCKYSTLKSYAVDNGVAESNFMSLMCSAQVLWNRIKVTYKGVGMSAASSTYVIADGLTIYANPQDTKVTLRLKSGIDNQSFELNSSTFGILNTNRLG